MCEPRPGTAPNATTSKDPPADSLALRSASISVDHRTRLALRRGSAPGDSSTASKSSRASGRFALRRADRRDLHDVRAHLHPDAPQEGLADRAAGDARRRLARRCALQDVAHVGHACTSEGRSGRRAPDAAGGPRRPAPHDRPRVHPLFPVGVVAVVDLQRDRPAQRAPVTHAAVTGRCRARSSFARPRPWPSWRRAMSSVDRLALELEPRRQPLDDARKPGPCDSPAVISSIPTQGRLFAQAWLEVRRRRRRRARCSSRAPRSRPAVRCPDPFKFTDCLPFSGRLLRTFGSVGRQLPPETTASRSCRA